MAVKTKTEEIDYKSEYTSLSKKHITVTNAVKQYITSVDELFKGKPSNEEVGRVLASLIIDLEKSVNS